MTTPLDRLSAALSDRYALERELGQGGMATVYLARDLRHDRRVAIKVVRPEIAAVIGAERFVREITTIAHLQHPHILGLIDSGEAGGTAYYVMPFVEGESLRTRIQREKQLPIADAVRLTTEVAAALDYAHRHGVIHRDIKPENILLHDGSALVADFGIALAASTAGTRMTETGMSLGTPQYMSPEQAMGEREITAAADIYALGCVAYEMLTGDPPFSGSTAQAIVAKVVTELPRSLVAQRHTIPPNVDQAVLTALEKLPADRFATAGEFGAALGERGYTSAMASRPAAAAGSRLRDPVFLGVTAVAAAAIVTAGFALLRKTPSALPPFQFVVATNDSTRAFDNYPWPAAISPDGSEVAYTVLQPGTGQQILYLLRTSELTARPIPGTVNSWQPYFSPDGQWLAFESGGKEKKVRLDGSAPVVITDAAGANGGDWSSRNDIILGAQGGFTGLSWVPSAGGTPVLLTKPDSARGERNHLWPVAFPDGKAVAFVIWTGSLARARLAIASFPDGAYTSSAIEAIRPLAVLDGMIVYIKADGTVMAVRADERGRRVIGSPIPVHDPVAVTVGVNGNSGAYVSSGGAMVTSAADALGRLAWIGPNGRVQVISLDPGAYVEARLSPDERRVALVRQDNAQSDVWIYDFGPRTLSRLTTIGTVATVEWSPDGSKVVYGASGEGGSDIWIQNASGGQPPKLLYERPYSMYSGLLSPNGKALLVTESPVDWWRLEWVPVDSPGVVHPYLELPHADVHNARFSPDGKWIVITSDESGQDEVYVRSFPDPSLRMQVSVGGGTQPMWSADGRRILYTNGSVLLGARVELGSAPRVLGRDTVSASFSISPFAASYFTAGYQVARDGRILTIAPDRDEFHIVVAPNWITEFRRKVAEAGGGR